MASEERYRQLVGTVSQQSGLVAGGILEQLYRLGHTKQPCDVCLKTGQVFANVTIGADFIYALEFESDIETVVSMLSEVKVISGDLDPVVRIALENIDAVIPMPGNPIPDGEIEKIDVRRYLTRRSSKGETLETFIRNAYKPKTDAELLHYAARYVVAHKLMD